MVFVISRRALARGISRRALAHGFCTCNGRQPGARALRLMGRAGVPNLLVVVAFAGLLLFEFNRNGMV